RAICKAVRPGVRGRIELEVVNARRTEGGRRNDGAADVGEITRIGNFKCGGNGVHCGCALNDAKAFVIGKKERSVPQDRAANASTKLVLAKLGTASNGCKVVSPVNRVIAKKLKYRTMQVIGSTSCDQIDYRSRSLSHFGRIEICLDAKFGNCINRGTDANSADSAFIIVD